MRMTDRLYLTADQKKVVNENSRQGRFLFCKPGDEIPNSTAIKYGLMKSPEEVARENKRLEAAEKKRLAAEEKAASKKKKAPNKKVKNVPNKKVGKPEEKASGLTINRLSGEEIEKAETENRKIDVSEY